jgi:16S rRNA (guanine1207-N2)-methyltransferase/23S rRNA (guanine1835-N2)-methyltransferase
MPKLTTPKGNLLLDCYPKVATHIQQPWDAADLYLIEDAFLGKHPAILNDQWGALTCYSHSRGMITYSWCDSFCSQFATKRNLNTLNSIDNAETHLDSGLPSLPGETDSIWIQCPKSFDQLHWWLTLALDHVGSGVPVYVAGMSKHIPIKWLNWLEKYNDDYKQYPIKKKARLLGFNLGAALPPCNAVKGYIGPDQTYLSSLPGVFSRDHMDIGSRFFIHNLCQLPPFTGNVLDLGCGNGLLSIAILAKSDPKQVNLSLCDDSALALIAAKENIKKISINNPTLYHTDTLLGVEGPVDTILCNPPFHNGNRVSTAAAERMFKRAAKILTKEGQLLVVANRHLGYASSLKKSFAIVKLLASDTKFVIYRCQRGK